VATAPVELSTVQSATPAGALQQASGTSSVSNSSGATDQFVALTQQVSGSVATARAAGVGLSSVSSSNLSVAPSAIGKDASKATTSDATGLKGHTSSASEQTGTQTSSQDSASSGGQSQNGSSAQGQNTVPTEANFASHAVATASGIQNVATASSVQTSSTHANVPASAAATTQGNATASAAVPQASPVINTAKLIQSIGQSEIRVGMHSSEFGNISISTSTTRDVTSAQISLDHGELAKVIAAHLPEMQAKLSGNQALDVRIDVNGDRSGQGAGTSSSMSNGSADQSRSGRQQPGNAVSNYGGNSVVEGQLSTVSSAATASYDRLDARLDIRV
jgi:hypothetical protein